MDVVGRTCVGRNTGQLLIFVALWGRPYVVCMLTWLLQVADLGSKRVTCLVLFGWQALSVCWTSTKDNRKIKLKCCCCGHSTRQSCIFALVLHLVSHSFFPFIVSRAGRSSLYLWSDLPIPCLQHWKEISANEKTQKKLAGASMGKSVTVGVGSKVSEHDQAVSRGDRHRMVSASGATVPVGNCNHFN